MEVDEINGIVITRSQESGTEVPSSLLLAKSRTRNNTDTSAFEQLQAVELIGNLIDLLGGVNCLLGDCDAGEKVHGTLGLLDLNTLHLLERLVEVVGTVLERVENAIVFRDKGLV